MFQTKTAAITLLRGLATSDIMVCLLVFPIAFCRCIDTDQLWRKYFKTYYEVYVYLPLANTFATSSLWLVVVVSVERYDSEMIL